MRTLVIGDIHGHSGWQDIVKNEKYDKVVFLGDYFDNFAGTSIDEQSKNFQEILDFQKTLGDKCILLYGNHDHSYYNREHCSGYKYQHQNIIEVMIYKAVKKHGMKIIYVDGDIIYSHAGVSKVWMDQVADIDKLEDISFDKIVNLDVLNWNSLYGYNPYGDTESNSPIWIRPNALSHSKVEGYRQIVGHTHFREPLKKSFLPDIYVGDLLPHYYIIVEDGKVEYVKNKLK